MDAVTPDVFCAMIIAELLGNAKSIKKMEDFSIFSEMAELIFRIELSIKKHSYSKESLILLITNKFLPEYAIEDLKRIFGESAFFSFPENLNGHMLFKSKSQYPPALRNNYGEEEFICENKNTAISEIETARPKKIKQNSKNFLKVIDIIPKAKALYFSLISENQIRQDAKYTWQWCLSAEEYQQIKHLFKNIRNFSAKSLEKDKYLAHLFRLLTGEYYKREYTKQGDNPFLSIDFKGSESEKSKITKKVLEIECINTFGKKDGQKRDSLLFSLFVDGGLPIGYISTCDDSIVSTLRNLLSDDEEDIEKGENSIENYFPGGIALKRSYSERGSIFEFIYSFRDKEHFLHVSDYSKAPFNLFISRIVNECIKNVTGDKFSLSFDVWKYDPTKEFSLKEIVNFRSGENYGEHGGEYISNSRLESWNVINSYPNAFIVSFKNEDSPYVSAKFVKCQGFYREFRGRHQIQLCQLDANSIAPRIFNNDYLKITYSDGSDDIAIIQKRSRKKQEHNIDCVQLFSNDKIEWTTEKGPTPWTYSAVLFNSFIWTIADNFSFIEESITEDLHWVCFRDSITLINAKGERVFFKNIRGQIIASPPEGCRHSLTKSPIIKNINEGQVKMFFGNEDYSSYLITDRYVNFKPTDKKGEPISNFIIEYKTSFETEYQNYSKGSRLSQGPVIFKISKDGFSTIIPCYVLNENATIKPIKESGRKRLKFDQIEHIEGVDNSGNLYDELPVKWDNPTSLIKIGKEDYIELEVCRPLNDSFHFIETSEGQFELITIEPSSQNNNDIKIPIVYANELITRTFNGKIGYSDNYIKKEHKIEINYLLCRHLLKGQYFPKQCSDQINYVTFSPYSSTFTSNSGFEKLDREKYEILFLKLADNSVSKAPLDFNHIEEEGILFQSLENNKYGDRYYLPAYVCPNMDFSLSLVEKAKRRNINIANFAHICDNDSPIPDSFFQQFEVACRYGLYFGTFDSLQSLIFLQEEDKNGDVIPRRLIKFFNGYYKFCINQKNRLNIGGLWKMADEFLFDWLFIPYQLWETFAIDIDKKNIVIELLRHSTNFHTERPYLDNILSHYWDLSNLKTKKTKNCECKVFLNYILGKDSFFQAKPTLMSQPSNMDKEKNKNKNKRRYNKPKFSINFRKENLQCIFEKKTIAQEINNILIYDI